MMAMAPPILSPSNSSGTRPTISRHARTSTSCPATCTETVRSVPSELSTGVIGVLLISKVSSMFSCQPSMLMRWSK
jgi:hypothetical protein